MNNSRSFFLLPALLLFLGLASCDKDQAIETLQQQEDAARQEISFELEDDMAVYTQLMDTHQARMDAMGVEFRNCQNVVRVPQDHPTIQAAIDAVCDGGKVFVHTGVYNENVTVYKPGLDIKANGEVTINGTVALTPDADNVSIQQFHIVRPTGSGFGIVGAQVSGVQIKLNTVTGGDQAIRFTNSTGVSVTHNTLSGHYWGITFVANIGSSCDNNTIAYNNVTETLAYSPIHVQGTCNNNLIRNNAVTLKTNLNPNVWYNAGITLFSLPGRSCDNNTVRNNVVTDNFCSGLWLIGGGANNTIGPDNIFNSNASYGIFLPPGTTGNHVFDNTALNNGTCDILNQGTGNTFANNTAGCTIGL